MIEKTAPKDLNEEREITILGYISRKDGKNLRSVGKFKGKVEADKKK